LRLSRESVTSDRRTRARSPVAKILPKNPHDAMRGGRACALLVGGGAADVGLREHRDLGRAAGVIGLDVDRDQQHPDRGADRARGGDRFGESGD